LDAAGDAVVVTDAEGVILEVNTAAERMNGIARDAALGRTLLDVGAQLGAGEAELAAVREALAGTVTQYETSRPGDDLPATVTVTALPGTCFAWITEGLERHRERHSREGRAAILAETARALSTPRGIEGTLDAVADILVPAWVDALLIVLADSEGRLSVASVRTTVPEVADHGLAMLPEDLSGADSGSLFGQIIESGEAVLVRDAGSEALPPTTRLRLHQLGVGSIILAPLIAEGAVVGTLVVARPEGARPFREEDRELFAALGERIALGIRAARLHDAVRTEQERFRTAFNASPIGTAVLQLDGNGGATYVEVNEAWAQIVGMRREDVLARPTSAITHPDEREGELERAGRLIEGEVSEVSVEKRILRGDGETRWVQVRSAPLGDGTFVTMMQDVTEARRAQNELEHLATHDALTGLPNRRAFEDALDAALAGVQRHGDHAAVVTLDIDNFKHVNDTFGHAIGDELLLAVAEALERRVRATDNLGRLGGDEFGVVLARADADASHAVTLDLLAAVREATVSVNGHKVRVTASAGLRALQPGDAREAGEILSEADMAMYDAKERGRDRLSVLGLQQPERVRARIGWSERIREALEGTAETHFVLHEQPIVRLSDGVTDRSELLIRLVTADGEVHPPGAFLGVAARYGQVQAIDRWVVARAVRLLAERPGHTFEVNLAGESIDDPAVIDAIANEVRGAAIDPSCLIFEVTETSAIADLERARELAGTLTDLGCGFALDDFGAGFASFAWLKHLPLDTIKIDGQFIRELATSQADQIFVRAIVSVARGLGKETVAEFVEDAETLALLAKLGVDRAQGYHVGRPVPVQAAAQSE
jgi:diguanylate cyclase (GGDEF)-like protein/PAS domain S-box-containing protein